MALFVMNSVASAPARQLIAAAAPSPVFAVTRQSVRLGCLKELRSSEGCWSV